MRIVAIIPAHNEERFIGDVVIQTKRYVDAVYVVDNNSTDKTARIAQSYGAVVIPEGIKGAGAATSAGWRIAKGLAKIGHCNILVTLDGDGQHNPHDIPRIIAPILQGQADVVFGSRFIGKNNIPAYRKLGIWIITICCDIGKPKRILTDAQCCLRAFGLTAIMDIDLTDKGFGFSIEEIMKARKLKLRIKEVPVECVYRGLKSDSTMNPIKHGISVLLKVLEWRCKLWI
jgi:glycosyltransferase involved in cell wall biosynthesis